MRLPYTIFTVARELRFQINVGCAIGVAAGGAVAPRIQDWQSTKNRRLAGPIPYVLLELLHNEKL